MIVDVNMPVMDGPALLRELHARGLQVPCVVVTADHRASDLLTDVAVDAIVAKPFDINALLSTVLATCGSCEPASPAAE